MDWESRLIPLHECGHIAAARDVYGPIMSTAYIERGPDYFCAASDDLTNEIKFKHGVVAHVSNLLGGIIAERLYEFRKRENPVEAVITLCRAEPTQLLDTTNGADDKRRIIEFLDGADPRAMKPVMSGIAQHLASRLWPMVKAADDVALYATSVRLHALKVGGRLSFAVDEMPALLCAKEAVHAAGR